MRQEGRRAMGGCATDELRDVIHQIHVSSVCAYGKIRMGVLAHLACGPMTVAELASVLAISPTRVSKHLGELKDSRMVRMRTRGRHHVFAMSEHVRVRCVDEALEIRIEMAGGRWMTTTLPRELIRRLHPEARFDGDVPETLPFPGVASMSADRHTDGRDRPPPIDGTRAGVEPDAAWNDVSAGNTRQRASERDALMPDRPARTGTIHRLEKLATSAPMFSTFVASTSNENSRY